MLSRRQFLKRLGITAGIAAIGGWIAKPDVPGASESETGYAWATDAERCVLHEINPSDSWTERASVSSGFEDGQIGLMTMASSDDNGMLWITMDGERHYLKCHDIDWPGYVGDVGIIGVRILGEQEG